MNNPEIKAIADRNIASTYLIRDGKVVGAVYTDDINPLIWEDAKYETMPKYGDEWLDSWSFASDDKVTAFENHKALVTLMANTYKAKPVMRLFMGIDVVVDAETEKLIEAYKNR